jgi:hypothetical protein
VSGLRTGRYADLPRLLVAIALMGVSCRPAQGRSQQPIEQIVASLGYATKPIDVAQLRVEPRHAVRLRAEGFDQETRLVMPFRILFTLLLVVLEACGPLTVIAQNRANRLSIEVLLLDTPRAEFPTRLWLRIRNGTRRAQILCRSSWGYSWISDDPQEKSTAEQTASLHGCGDPSHDPFWMLLPGESRFDSYEVTGPARPYGTLEVNVEVMHYPVGATGPGDSVDLSWKGRLADAIALGSKLRGR